MAQGAAIHAAILEAKFRGETSELAERVRKLLRSVKQEDVNSHGLGVAARNPKTGKMVNHVMIPRNSKLADRGAAAPSSPASPISSASTSR